MDHASWLLTESCESQTLDSPVQWRIPRARLSRFLSFSLFWFACDYSPDWMLVFVRFMSVTKNQRIQLALTPEPQPIPALPTRAICQHVGRLWSERNLRQKRAASWTVLTLQWNRVFLSTTMLSSRLPKRSLGSKPWCCPNQFETRSITCTSKPVSNMFFRLACYISQTGPPLLSRKYLQLVDGEVRFCRIFCRRNFSSWGKWLRGPRQWKRWVAWVRSNVFIHFWTTVGPSDFRFYGDDSGSNVRANKTTILLPVTTLRSSGYRERPKFSHKLTRSIGDPLLRHWFGAGVSIFFTRRWTNLLGPNSVNRNW